MFMRILIFMCMKANDNKKPRNISIRPSVIETAEKKAKKVAKKLKLPKVSLSSFIEIAINDYNAE
jgi:hypothetical protein